jgi:hypothetical protein
MMGSEDLLSEAKKDGPPTYPREKMSSANAMFFTSSFRVILPRLPIRMAMISVPATPPSDSFHT